MKTDFNFWLLLAAAFLLVVAAVISLLGFHRAGRYADEHLWSDKPYKWREINALLCIFSVMGAVVLVFIMYCHYVIFAHHA
jgi:hypothetical protein